MTPLDVLIKSMLVFLGTNIASRLQLRRLSAFAVRCTIVR